jgi:RNA polymerase sigma-70 factor (ECF subfamily)
MAFLDYWSNVALDMQNTERDEPEHPEPSRTAEDVFYAYGPRVYRLARSMLPNDADAEDVTQDVLLQVVRKLDTFRGDSDLTTWLHRITVNAVLLHRRKQSRRQERQVDTPLEVLLNGDKYVCTSRAVAAPDAKVLREELDGRIDAAVAQLPDLYRDVYILAGIQELSNEEAGEQLGLSVSAIKSRLHRARQMMRATLGSYFQDGIA